MWQDRTPSWVCRHKDTTNNHWAIYGVYACLSRKKEQNMGKPGGKPCHVASVQNIHQIREELNLDQDDIASLMPLTAHYFTSVEVRRCSHLKLQ